DEVALPEAPRLQRKAPQPLQSGPLHPAGGAGPASGGKIERSPDAHRHDGVEAVPVTVHPEFLLRRSQGHEQARRLGRVHRVHGRLRRRPFGLEVVRRAVGPRHAQPRKSGLEPPGRHVGDARLPAEEEHRVPAPRREPAQGRHEIGAGDPGAERPAEQTRPPDDRHAVRHAQGSPLARDPKRGVLPEPHDEIDVHRHDVTPDPTGDCPVEPRDRLLKVDIVKHDIPERHSPDRTRPLPSLLPGRRAAGAHPLASAVALSRYTRSTRSTTRSQPKRAAAARARSPRPAACAAGSRSACTTTSAARSSSPKSTRMPLTSAWMSSRWASTVFPITRLPDAIASITAIPNPSYADGASTRCARARYSVSV